MKPKHNRSTAEAPDHELHWLAVDLNLVETENVVVLVICLADQVAPDDLQLEVDILR